MSTNFIATAAPDTFVNSFHTVNVSINFIGGGPPEISGALPGDPVADMIKATNGVAGLYFFDVYDRDSVDYGSSPAPVTIDLNLISGQSVPPPQSGGYASGDLLVNMFEIIGSTHDDVIRGSDPLTSVFHDPGSNFLVGGLGSDLLEGRGGADVLVGGSLSGLDPDFDYASYESSPALVKVRLAGIGADTQTAVATGGDAEGDTLIGIEGLIGSPFDDQLTGNSLNNVLAGGLGNDILDGKAGIDTVDYSRDHFYGTIGSRDDTADEVTVKLGLNGANGSGAEFQIIPGSGGNGFIQVSADTLVSIENVTGTDGADTIIGNEQDNVIDGRGGVDLIDGGFGNDTLIGGDARNSVSYVSHDTDSPPSGEINKISLGLNGAAGSFTRSESSPFGLPIVVETDALLGFQNVQGSTRPEIINGNEQNNLIDARGGNDTLDGGLGNDTLIGGDGIDTVSYVSHDNVTMTTGVTVALGLGTSDGSATATIPGSGPLVVLETDILRSIENVNGSSHDDAITGNSQANVLNGRGGNDTLDGGLGNDTLIGGGGNDTAAYFSHDNLAFLNKEQDVIALGLNGADGIFTRSQVTSSGQIQVVEQDVLSGIANVIGSNHDETISGNEQANIVAGRGGNDNLNGGGGDDVYNYSGAFGASFGNDRIFDTSGTDTIVVTSFSNLGFSSHGNDLILTLVDGAGKVAGTIQIVDQFNGHQVENIVDASGNSMVLAAGLVGGNAPGIIVGGDGDETLDGKGGNDFLFGGKGNDRLIGGQGDDLLTGGKGNDTFVFAAGFGHDVIKDFSDGDRIEFDDHLFPDFHAVLASTREVNGNVVITLDQNDSVTLEGTNLHDLHAHNFLFL